MIPKSDDTRMTINDVEKAQENHKKLQEEINKKFQEFLVPLKERVAKILKNK